ncbi:MAG: hypothetical protein KME46_05495 [Brasilonema angustatum HA4187-MV1]|jgi:poly(3-hydroxybutyrate) depolymerase|nr:hypothetical protein [Brasilonema angustatum HA4187-MV1]
MKRLFAFITIAFLYFYFAHLVNASELVSTHSDNSCTLRVLKKGEGCFLYKVEAGNFSIPVYYYLPNQLEANTKVVFAMHGEKRNAEDYRNDWRNIYNGNGSGNPNFILLAPQFQQKRFPLAPGYNLGNMFTQDLNTLNPQNQWAFTEIENIFSFVKTSIKINTTNYYLYGHSAGAQFVHRMVIFMPHAHIKKAVAAEGGSYTIPDEYTDYPCGFKKETGDKLPSVDLKTTFSTPMTIILGTKDNKPLSPEHDTYKCDAQQGSNRLARGEYFYTKVKSIADNRKEDFQWTLKKVSAAHIVPKTNPPIEDPMLVSCAAKEFFPELTGVNCK